MAASGTRKNQAVDQATRNVSLQGRIVPFRNPPLYFLVLTIVFSLRVFKVLDRLREQSKHT